MNENCRGCIRYLRSCSGLSMELCEKHHLRIPMTNADRIRAITDKELTELLYAWHLSTFSKKKEWIHNWLKKEVQT